MKNEEINKLLVVIAPPMKVVGLIPSLSLTIPDIMDNRNVVPIINEPINAV